MANKPYIKPVNKRRAKAAAVSPLPAPRIARTAGWWDAPTLDNSIRAIRASSVDQVSAVDRTDRPLSRLHLRSGETIVVTLTIRDALAAIDACEKAAP